MLKKKKVLCIITALMITVSSLLLSGCGGNGGGSAGDGGSGGSVEGGDVQQEAIFTPETLPAIDGALALAPYYESMAAKLMNMDIEEARQWVSCNNTPSAYENLINGKADIIFCAQPSEEQKQMAADAGFEFEMTPFINGAFVFFVNKDNPVDSLTKQQLYDIYAGKITNWSEVGGDDVEIIPYQRNENSGSQTGLYAFLIPEDEVMEAPTEMKIESMGGIVDAIANYENSAGALGFSYYYYVTNMKYSDQVKLIAVDGVAPSDESIMSEEYPMVNTSYAVTDASEAENSPVRTILKWIVSPEGQKTAKEAGYVPKYEIK